MKELIIPRRIFDEMLSHSLSVIPIEACGIVAGRADRAETFHPMKNADNSAEHFMLDPREQFAVIKAIRSAGQEMLAIFHSHPETPARPSEEDMRMALTPGVYYLILSLQDRAAPVLNGFLVEDGRSIKTGLKIIDVQKGAINAG